MKIILLLFVFTFFFKNYSYSTKFDWTRYVPQSRVDSILLLSTNCVRDAYYRSEEGCEIFLSPEFPLENYSDYERAFELKKTIKKSEDVKDLVSYFPLYSCGDSKPLTRCQPIYRDCVVFFRKGEPISAIKICFSCLAIQSTPFQNGVNCLMLESRHKVIAQKWIDLGLIDLMRRE